MTLHTFTAETHFYF